jgi:tetratricopeptide (TPR) repeat protein
VDEIDEDALDAALQTAEANLSAGALADARVAYETAEAMLVRERGPRLAEVLERLARIARDEGRADDAVRLLDRALAEVPRFHAALVARIEIAHAASDPATAVAMHARLAAMSDEDDQRFVHLGALAGDALAAAARAVRAALEIRQADRNLVGLLRTLCEAAGDWVGAVNAAVAYAEITTEPRERARAFVVAAELCEVRAGNIDRAVALYEAAIADDPATKGAFEAIESVLARSGDHEALARAYQRQLERLEEAGSTSGVRGILARLAVVCEESLDDVAGAISALDRLCTLAPDDVEARAHLAELLDRVGETALAVRCLEVAAERGPSRVETFRSLRELFIRRSEVDRAFAATAVLVHLGEADPDEQAAYQAFAPTSTLSPSRPIAADEWTAVLPPGDVDVARLVSLVAGPARAARLEALRVAGRLPVLDPKDRQDPDKTTVTAVRTVAWAARLLGLPIPEIHARSHDPGGLAMAASATPVLVLGRGILHGHGVPELAFAFARELAFHQATSYLGPLFPSTAELKTLVMAAMGVAMPELSTAGEVSVLRNSLAARLGDDERRELSAVVRTIAARGGALDLSRWLRGAESLACRAGLLACGDLTAAARMLAIDGRVIGGMTGAERVRSLVPFSIGADYAALRAAIGVSAASARRSSTRPPPSHSPVSA